VQAAFDALRAEVTALAPKLTPPAAFGRGGGGGGGGRGGGQSESLLARIGQAKNGLTGGMWPTEQTTRAYNDAKKDVPKAIADANAVLARAATLSGTLAKYNLTLTVSPPVKTESPQNR
jgi:hypothetical protein